MNIMNITEARQKIRDLADTIPEDAAEIQKLFKEEAGYFLFNSSEAPAREISSIIWESGYLSGIAHAMQANRIPPFDGEKAGLVDIFNAIHAVAEDFIERAYNDHHEHF